MRLRHVAFDAPLEAYAAQASELLAAHEAGDAEALRLFHEKHPRFLDSEIKWLPRLDLTEDDIRNATIDLSDAQMAAARWYDFRDWQALVAYTVSADLKFEAAVEAVINGDLDALRSLLGRSPGLVHARSNRITCFDPPVHGATLLHYLGANGVEGYRQISPQNAVEVAEALLGAGADPDALAHMYGGESTVLPMLVSSTPPAEAGTQVPLIDVLVDHGASVEPRGSGHWMSPLITALVFGFVEAAQALVRRGATVDLVAAAGLGRTDDVARLLPEADAGSRHRAMALAGTVGQVETMRLLLDAGEDPNRFNPEGMHAHTTPLHQAALRGDEAMARLLVERGARRDIQDKIYKSTPAGWANYAGKTELAASLQAEVD